MCVYESGCFGIVAVIAPGLKTRNKLSRENQAVGARGCDRGLRAREGESGRGKEQYSLSSPDVTVVDLQYRSATHTDPN